MFGSLYSVYQYPCPCGITILKDLETISTSICVSVTHECMNDSVQ
jgi:hypothetical protein